MKSYSPEDNIFDTLNIFPDPALREAILQNGKIIEIPKDEQIIREGQYLDALPIVLSGSIRVFQQSEDREILLYYVTASTTCVMSLSACFFNNPSSSAAITEEETKILSIPSSCISKWQREYKSWNEYILEAFTNRYYELLESFQSITFNHTDKRIWEYLNFYANSHGTKTIPLSHQKLANELGTTRVVVSRILKQLEIEGRLVLDRRSITLL